MERPEASATHKVRSAARARPHCFPPLQTLDLPQSAIYVNFDAGNVRRIL
jgi:hypothetical protein